MSMDMATLMQSLGSAPGPGGPPMDDGGMAEPTEKPDPIKMLTDALQLVRQATDAEDDPQMSLQLEQISSMIQKAIASDHADTLGSLGMKPGMNRILAKAAG